MNGSRIVQVRNRIVIL